MEFQTTSQTTNEWQRFIDSLEFILTLEVVAISSFLWEIKVPLSTWDASLGITFSSTTRVAGSFEGQELDVTAGSFHANVRKKVIEQTPPKRTQQFQIEVIFAIIHPDVGRCVCAFFCVMKFGVGIIVEFLASSWLFLRVRVFRARSSSGW